VITTTPREVSWDVVAVALERGGWSCFCPPTSVAAVKTKVSKIARRLRIRLVTAYDQGRFIAVPEIAGRCDVRRSRPGTEAMERRALQDVALLQQTIRRLMAAHTLGGTLRA
jgi:hypothetical protein